jgi:hypothetical protein
MREQIDGDFSSKILMETAILEMAIVPASGGEF